MSDTQRVQGLMTVGAVGRTETSPVTHQPVTKAWRWSPHCGPLRGPLKKEGLLGRRVSLFAGGLWSGTLICLGEFSRENSMVKRQFPFS